MSRGLGRVERDILEHITPYRPRRLDFLASITGHHPESVRRAMKSLEIKGLVALGRDNGYRVVDGAVMRMWETTVPTAVRVSAGDCSTLSQQIGGGG